jgi:hypothetical protein
MSIEFSTAVDQLKSVYSVLAGDLQEAIAYGQSNPSGFARRGMFRAAFALIEGLSFQFRTVALAGACKAPQIFSSAEISLLKEERVKLDDKGHPKVQSEFQRLLPNIIFCMRCYAKVRNTTFEPDFGVNGYGCMKNFIELRNEIEHPKSAASLEHTDQQICDAMEAMRWWKLQVLTLLEKCSESDNYWKERLA